jgi:hypothetical protein
MPQDALHSLWIHSRAQEQRRRRMAQAVERDVAGYRLGPHSHAAPFAAARLTIVRLDRVAVLAACLAPTAKVVAVLDEPGALQRSSHDGDGVEVLAPPTAAGRREDELAACRGERVLEEGPERLRDGNGVAVASLGRIATM